MSSVISALGVVVSCGLFSSALPATLRARKAGALSEDPTPAAVTLINCLIWILYASVIGDVWIFGGCICGVFCNAFNTCVAIRLADRETAQRIETIVCVGLTMVAVSVMVLGSSVVIPDAEVRVRLLSNLCQAICLAMFASPLVQSWQAMASRDASRINSALTAMQLLNGILWTTTGLIRQDRTLVVPNGASIALALVNLIVKLSLGRRAKPRGPATKVVAVGA
mmetsp:Transcript_16695/g.43137  ORF Transcript_16695/g.43137 Transcript_16695/m.43137 type:complete len:224 (+) Transcript_16695:81-752(+)|eukprot:CAMPEP_0183548730 /NCGR_PEP_ID=MMETSP0371-20130417/60868_1 /TAXON_ID=268820 /ORGANISM="Peridinium aciculiferum, Strain PAER-2" /LENGTH=223 /DNA_ID=CAMNT_0025752207 /DNA_START=81 /DNA_END=752 /DNA_ORIENTATION=+